MLFAWIWNMRPGFAPNSVPHRFFVNVEQVSQFREIVFSGVEQATGFHDLFFVKKCPNA